MMTGIGEAPFDIIGDYYRGTLGALTDQLECPDMIEKVCDMLADMQIASYEYFKTAPLPVKRVFFPLHKGMDGFMSPAQYEKLNLETNSKKSLLALIDMGVTPFIYTEGKYNSRLEQLADVPAEKSYIILRVWICTGQKKSWEIRHVSQAIFPFICWSTEQNSR